MLVDRLCVYNTVGSINGGLSDHHRSLLNTRLILLIPTYNPNLIQTFHVPNTDRGVVHGDDLREKGGKCVSRDIIQVKMGVKIDVIGVYNVRPT